MKTILTSLRKDPYWNGYINQAVDSGVPYAVVLTELRDMAVMEPAQFAELLSREEMDTLLSF